MIATGITFSTKICIEKIGLLTSQINASRSNFTMSDLGIIYILGEIKW